MVSVLQSILMATGKCARNLNLTNKWYMHNRAPVLEKDT